MRRQETVIVNMFRRFKTCMCCFY